MAVPSITVVIFLGSERKTKVNQKCSAEESDLSLPEAWHRRRPWHVWKLELLRLSSWSWVPPLGPESF